MFTHTIFITYAVYYILHTPLKIISVSKEGKGGYFSQYFRRIQSRAISSGLRPIIRLAFIHYSLTSRLRVTCPRAQHA